MPANSGILASQDFEAQAQEVAQPEFEMETPAETPGLEKQTTQIISTPGNVVEETDKQ